MAKKKIDRREWFVAVACISGEHEGAPPNFDSAEVHGPYTARHAQELADMGEGFPEDTFTILAFCPKRTPFRTLRAALKYQIDAANQDRAAEDAARREIGG
jgi:hypothetical protein